MRLSARTTDAHVVVAPESARPIRLRIVGLSFCLTTTEALQLANELADAVNDSKSTEGIPA